MNHHIITFSAVAMLTTASCSGDVSKVCASSQSGWRKVAEHLPELAPVQTIYLRKSGEILWNGRRIDKDEWIRNLRAVPDLTPRPFVILKHEQGTDCDRLSAIRRQMDEVLECSNGLCGEGEGEGWRRY